MSLLSELHNLMAKYRFRPNKKISQHFVVSEQLIQRLVDLAGLKESDKVLEIGPGAGFLTRKLMKKCRTAAVEIDQGLCQLLEEELDCKNLHVLCGDFLKVELPEFNKVVSLPPYSQSSAIVRKLLEFDFELGVFVFQKEFAGRLVALPGFKEYCALSVLTQYAFEAKVVQRVASNSFFPKPKGESCIVVLNTHNKFAHVKDRVMFSLFVKTLFRFRNKNLRNALDKSKQFLLPALKMDEAKFSEKTSDLQTLEKKVGLIPVQLFVKAFNQIDS